MKRRHENKMHGFKRRLQKDQRKYARAITDRRDEIYWTLIKPSHKISGFLGDTCTTSITMAQWDYKQVFLGGKFTFKKQNCYVVLFICISLFNLYESFSPFHSLLPFPPYIYPLFLFCLALILFLFLSHSILLWLIRIYQC